MPQPDPQLDVDPAVIEIIPLYVLIIEDPRRPAHAYGPSTDPIALEKIGRGETARSKRTFRVLHLESVPV